jgi:hypothetical protein
MYVVVFSRPDLSYTMNLVSRNMANPGKNILESFSANFQVPSWRTFKACLKFGKTEEGLAGYVDSDFDADLDKRRCLIGNVFTIRGCVVSWKAALQHVVAQSTTEIEYMAIAETSEGLYG